MDVQSDSQTGGALFVVDMQACYLNLYKDQEYVERRIGSVNRAIREARAKGMPVIFIEHEFTGALMRLVSGLFLKGAGIRGRDGFHIDERVDKSAAEPVYLKTKEDLFSVNSLAERLKKDGIENVLLSGQDGLYCIKGSARGARRRGFKVSILDSCVLASNDRKWRLEKAALESEGVRII
ncbi:MAG: isochorismatase family protein [Opitutaceae bacterium]|jgi:nicotinamidase-related amidase